MGEIFSNIFVILLWTLNAINVYFFENNVKNLKIYFIISYAAIVLHCIVSILSILGY